MTEKIEHLILNELINFLFVDFLLKILINSKKKFIRFNYLSIAHPQSKGISKWFTSPHTVNTMLSSLNHSPEVLPGKLLLTNRIQRNNEVAVINETVSIVRGRKK